MTTRQNDRVVVEPSGIVRVCSWCLPKSRRMELQRLHRCSDGVCPPCLVELEKELA